jgi:hypothetical protein
MRNGRLGWGLNAIVLAASLAGCGGDGGGGGSCGKVEACGGDIKGVWTVANSCVDSTALMTQIPPAISAMCPTAQVTTARVNTTGSYTFNADLTYTTMLSQTGTGTVDVPQSCLTLVSDCSGLTAFIQLALTLSPVPSVQSITCAGSAGCVCTIVPVPVNTNDTGTYSTAGNMLMTRSSAGFAISRNYCVQGLRELHFMTLDQTMNTGPAGQPTITADIVARRQ